MADMEASSGVEVVRDEGEDDIGVDYGDALEAAYSDRGSQKGSDSLFQRQADALVKMAQGYLAGGKDKTSCTADHYQVMVHAAAVAVDEKALRGVPDENSKSDLPIETVRRLSCDCAVVTVTENEKGDPLHVGRKHRVVQPALRRALEARDRTCRFPGCTQEKWLDAQSLPRSIGCHVVGWAEGGETSLDNCLLLCSTHHRLLHEGGFRIKADANGEWQFSSS
jgi:hypothetical protein